MLQKYYFQTDYYLSNLKAFGYLTILLCLLIAWPQVHASSSPSLELDHIEPSYLVAPELESTFVEKYPGVYLISAKDNLGTIKTQEVRVKALDEGQNQITTGPLTVKVRDGTTIHPGNVTIQKIEVRASKERNRVFVDLIIAAEMPIIIVRAGKIELQSIAEENRARIRKALNGK